MSLVDIIIPSYTNPHIAVPCVKSILRDSDGSGFFHVYLVNNGDYSHASNFPKHSDLTLLQMKKNVGWEKGLKEGLSYSRAPYVVFMNDDTFVPQSSIGWLRKMTAYFADPRCGGVGPSSNFVMGNQQIFTDQYSVCFTTFLIGLCFMVRRSDLDAAGGVDDTLPGGDDLDLSIRLRDLGKYLICDRTIFIYHHGQQTGRSVHGADWDSIRHQEAVRFALIRKHGLRKYLGLFTGSVIPQPKEDLVVA